MCERPQTETGPNCRYCGTALHLTCPSCGTQQPAAALRCGHCGTSLAAYRKTFAAIREALELSAPDAERELTALLSTAPDARIVRDALARLPLAPPTAVSAQADNDAVRLRWHPSASTGEISYRLSRQITAAGHEASRGLGRTASTNFEDAGAPGGLCAALPGDRGGRRPVQCARAVRRGAAGPRGRGARGAHRTGRRRRASDPDQLPRPGRRRPGRRRAGVVPGADPPSRCAPAPTGS
ncbi:hypothetical protein [Fodinicola feengrottensis]|uniref:hypothetical protein n=1 Tax=Fodinicola feengrottensis TaxID=435914 RepID=UPI0013D2EF16|nr:hypothetical protein [Fodinicola feengrottensis]